VAFVGYTPQFAASVMVLNPKHNQDVGAYGGRGAAPIWHDAMAPILDGQPDVGFPPPGIPLQDPTPPPPPRPQPQPVPDQVPAPDQQQTVDLPPGTQFTAPPDPFPFPFPTGN